MVVGSGVGVGSVKGVAVSISAAGVARSCAETEGAGVLPTEKALVPGSAPGTVAGTSTGKVDGGVSEAEVTVDPAGMAALARALAVVFIFHEVGSLSWP